MKTQHLLGSVRFLTTLGHLICILLLFSTYKVNVEVGLADNASSEERILANSNALSGLVIGVLCIALDLTGIVYATTLFNTQVNLIQIFMHFMGSLLLAWVIIGDWNFRAIWPIIGTCSIPTAVIEAVILFNTYFFNVQQAK